MSNERGRVSENVLHIYAQFTAHDDAVIVGTKDSLSALRDAIDKALSGHDQLLSSFTNDGEGFNCVVKLRERETFYNKVALPYGDFGTGLDPRDPEADL